MKMKRAQEAFPFARFPEGTRAAFQSQFKGVKMKCLTCPHRGMPLKGQPVVGNAVRCPGHGLTWNVNTGDLILQP